MLNADSLVDVIGVLTVRLPAFFPTVQAVSIAWLDPEHELAREWDAAGGPPSSRAALISLPSTAERLLPTSPQLGSLTAGQEQLFPPGTVPIRSAAIVPLRLRGQLIGSLNQGSADPGHFGPEAATDLIEHLAAVAALCVDNALNRARLQRDGMTDGLTGVANRRFFERRLDEEVNLWRRHGGTLSCLMIDIDHFKQINDRQGHVAGDRVLQQVARQLSIDLRASDVLARYGGEEFVLLLPSTDFDRSREIAERLRAAVARSAAGDPPAAAMPVTVSIGLASLSASGARHLPDSPGDWLVRRADEALYRAKAQGRNCVAAMPAATTARAPA